MHILEENYLRSIMLLDHITNRLTSKFNELGVSSKDFSLMHPAYIDLNMSFYHLAIFQARKLYEAKIREGLTEKEWLKLKSFREDLTHAREPKSMELREIGDLNLELIPILNKISNSIYEKYNLDNSAFYQNFVKSYMNDLEKL